MCRLISYPHTSGSISRRSRETVRPSGCGGKLPIRCRKAKSPRRSVPPAIGSKPARRHQRRRSPPDRFTRARFGIAADRAGAVNALAAVTRRRKSATRVSIEAGLFARHWRPGALGDLRRQGAPCSTFDRAMNLAARPSVTSAQPRPAASIDDRAGALQTLNCQMSWLSCHGISRAACALLTDHGRAGTTKARNLFYSVRFLMQQRNCEIGGKGASGVAGRYGRTRER